MLEIEKEHDIADGKGNHVVITQTNPILKGDDDEFLVLHHVLRKVTRGSILF